VKPFNGSPKKMGPPVAAVPAAWIAKDGREGVWGDVFGGVVVVVVGVRGRVSKERVRRHEFRIMEKEAGNNGSLVEMYSRK
jgi:hypothetical protein